MAIDYKKIVTVLHDGQVKFVLIGGVAAIVHGSARATFDVDVVYARDNENIERLVTALKPYKPYLRDAPPGLPFLFNEKTVQAGLNFTLTTTMGDLDLLGEVIGGGTFESLLPYSKEIEVFDSKCFCIDLEKLIQIKRAAGRPKDFEAIAELASILEEKQKQNS
jgi:predicted nucleotidyltransferase